MKTAGLTITPVDGLPGIFVRYEWLHEKSKRVKLAQMSIPPGSNAKMVGILLRDFGKFIIETDTEEDRYAKNQPVELR